MKYILITLMLIVITTSLFSQNYCDISGSINSAKAESAKSGLPFAGATVSLLKASDSAIIKLVASGSDGRFHFPQVKPGTYLVSVTATGYVKEWIKMFKADASMGSIQLPLVILKPQVAMLNNVTVVAKRPLIEMRIDRTIVNVEASVTNLGTSALEVLEKSPGITVDNEGNINLKGKDGILILIDGRPTQLSGADLANMLRSMSSNQMDQIEIMTNPPARYDAAGNAGIINIKTKKNTLAGYNGSFTIGYGQGRYPKINEGLNINYRKGKWNLFSNLSHNYRQEFGILTIQRRLIGSNGQPDRFFDQRADRKSNAGSYNARVGFDFLVSKKTTIGFSANSFYNPSDQVNRNNNLLFSSLKELETITSAVVDNESRWKNLSLNGNFRTLLDTLGKELSAEVDYIAYSSVNEQFMSNTYLAADGSPIGFADTLLGSLPQDLTIYSARIDYIHPFKKSSRMEFGLKSSIVETDANAIYDSIQSGNKVRDIGRSNHFLYNEVIHAAYANLSTPLTKKLSAQFGLRLENTRTRGNQLTTGEQFTRDYAQLFPTAFLQYKFNKKHVLAANYGRRIRRPNYQSLNPFIRFIDRYTYSAGNPDLKPQLSDNIEITHTFKNLLTTTINYTTTSDVIQGIIAQKGEAAFAQPSNIASFRQYGIQFNANNPITKWWSNSMTINIFNNRFAGIVNNESIDFAASGFTLNGTEQFKINGSLTAELSGGYRSGRVEGVNRLKPIGMINAGISKQVMKDKGTLRLTVRDIFYSMRQRVSVKYGNVDATFQEQRDSRVVNIGFTYRFKKGKVNPVRSRASGSANDEQGRIDVN